MDIKPLILKNKLSNQSEEFQPIKNGEVSMYHCGPTVYDRAHIGNLRPYVFADLLRRYFERLDNSVRQVINITDVGHLTSDADSGEDKVEKSSREKNKTAGQITQEYFLLFFEDLKKLNIKTEGTIFPKATENIPEQIEIIKILEEKNLTYRTSDGIYFDTSKMPDYGKLGEINLEGLEAGARIDLGERKNKTDFALWKFSPLDQKRQQEWDSPWGIGFPGWHIECSAMSRKFLGQPFDIHTGGMDHIAVHHNNEIAQSESAFEKPLAHYWMHSGFLTLNGEKISKSIGNVVYLEDLEKHNLKLEALKYFFLNTHYSSPINFTWEAVEGSNEALRRMAVIVSRGDSNKKGYHLNTIINIINSLSEDLNSPKALAELWKYLGNAEDIEEKSATILEADKIFGLNIEKIAQENLKSQNSIPDEIIKLQEKRDEARNKGNFKEADEIRHIIEEKGYQVKDDKETSIITRK